MRAPLSPPAVVFSTPNENSRKAALGRRGAKWCLLGPIVAALLQWTASPAVSQVTWGPAPGWTSANLGGATGGSLLWDGSGTFQIVGNGSGMASTGDQMFYGYQDVSGDFQFTVRIVSSTGATGSQVGIAVRQDTSGTAAYASGLSYVPNVNSGTRANSFGVFLRKTPALQDKWFTVLNPSDMKLPCWLRIVRVGNDLALYKSSNGSTWSTIYNTSGGAFVVSGTAKIGLFAATGTAGLSASVTGTVDNVSLISNPTLPFESSWLGNTKAADSTGYVSGNAKAMWVSPDGTCYVNGAGDETGQSAKIYKNGQVIKRVDNPPSGGGWEGSITGNYISSGTGNVFLTGAVNDLASGLYQVDLSGANAVPIYLSDPPSLDSFGIVMVSGLAYGNDRLYVSNPVTGKIYVSGTSRNSHGTQPRYMTNAVYSGSITVSGMYPAPQQVYQSQFQSTSMKFDFGGFSGTLPVYSVRLHFAEFETTGTNRSMTIKVGSSTVSSNFTSPLVGTGTILNVANVAPISGTISVVVNSNNSAVNAILNGVEILQGSTSYVRYNCGGPTFTDSSNGYPETWDGSINEIENFTPAGLVRPGPLAVDSRHDLWVVQEGGAFPTSTGRFNLPVGQASIRCYSGSAPYAYQGREITGLTNPTAICYDGTNDRLLVTENGEDQNVKIYTNLTGTNPVCSGTFGATKGVFSGTNPGLVYDSADHGNARFYGPTGVGVDSLGQVYVVCNSGPNITDLKAFQSTSDETLLWKLQALEFCNVGDFDPSVDDGVDVWTPSHHYTMDYSGTTPGTEWTLKSYLWNPFLLSGSAPRNEPRSTGVTAVYRKVGSNPFMYTAGQGALMSHTGTVNYGMDLFRFQGEQLIRCGEITYSARTMYFWTDSNRNGIETYSDGTQDEAKTSFQPRLTSDGIPNSFDVDSDGSIYFAMSGTGRQPYVLKLPAQLDSYGVPTYSSTGNVQKLIPTGTTTVVSGSTVHVGNSYFTEPSNGGNYWGTKAHLRYVKDTDTMYLEGEAYPGASSTDKNFGGYLERWDNWSTTPTKHFGVKLPDPASEPNFQNGAPPYTQPDGFCYEAMDVANGYTFVSDNWGAIQVVDPEGTIVAKLYAGPGVSGTYGWCDAVMGLRAHYNPATNEYIVIQENAGFHIRQNLYRWKPANRLLYANFQSGGNPFTASAGTGGATNLVSTGGGNVAVEFQDASISGDNATSTFTWTLPSTHPLVQRINQVLTGTSGVPATFAYQFKLKRSLVSSSPATFSNAMAYLETSPNDGNPPASGQGRDRFWTGLALTGTSSIYNDSYTQGQFLKIDEKAFPQGNDPTKSWRGLRFTVTPSSGTKTPITSLTIGFQARVNSNATPEAFQIDNLAVDEIQ